MVKKQKKSKVKKTKQYVWKDLTREEKDLYIALLWEDGFSDEAIGNFLKTSKGAVVGHRHRHLAHLKFGHTGKPKQIAIPAERLGDLLELDERDAMLEQGITPLTSGTDRHASTEEPLPDEHVEAAATGRNVVELKSSATTEKSAIPSTTDLPFLPPIDSVQEPSVVEEPPPAPVSVPEPAKPSRPITQKVVTECQYPKADGTLCGKPVRPGSKLCDEHADLAAKLKFL